MGNALKIILYTGAGLFVFCVGFVLIVPGLMDWNQYKGQIVDRVAYELGREFSVSGDISLSVIPQTKFWGVNRHHFIFLFKKFQIININVAPKNYNATS